ncbi:sigma factor, partial [Streptomyces mirabilis]
LLTVVMRMTRDYHLAHDVTQEACLAVIQEFRGGTVFRKPVIVYATVVARNKFLSELGRMRAQLERPSRRPFHLLGTARHPNRLHRQRWQRSPHSARTAIRGRIHIEDDAFTARRVEGEAVCPRPGEGLFDRRVYPLGQRK